MSSQQLDEEAIFHVVRGIPDPDTRAVYLNQTCAGDQALRERVEALFEQGQGGREITPQQRAGLPTGPPSSRDALFRYQLNSAPT